MSGRGTPEQALESLRIVWPSYFASPENVAPLPSLRICVEAYAGMSSEMTADSERISAALAATTLPYGVFPGAGSPMPWGQADPATVELSPNAFLKVVPGAGHFPWFEQPGCVRAALARLIPTPTAA
jgi:pimeloyl-ACP methyl ester carboxylesterase